MTILAGGWMAGVADENAGEERERERDLHLLTRS